MPYSFDAAWGNGGSGNAVTVSPTAGDAIAVMSVTSAGAGNPTATIADNISSSWQTAQATVNDGGGVWLTLFYLLNCGAGITTLTVTYNGGTPGTVSLQAAGWQGLASFLGISANNRQVNPGTGTDAVTSNNVNVTSQPAALIGFSGNISQTIGYAAGTGFTLRAGSGGSVGIGVEDKRTTSTGNQLVTFTDSNGASITSETFALAFAEPVSAYLPPGSFVAYQGQPILAQ